jgi:hypothetical protein
MAKCLIRFKRLTHVDYSVDEISELIQPHLPVSFPVEVPKGNGSFSLSKVDISMPHNQSVIQAQVLGALEVTYVANPIYRAHIALVVTAKPEYNQQSKNISLTELSIANIHLLNDEYSILKDTSSLINLFVPNPVLSMVTGTMKTAFSLMTGTTTSEANNYLQLYLGGSKQKILDYHKPQLERIIVELAASDDMQYSLDANDFEEGLFIQYGKTVEVEAGSLRFKF